MPITINANNYNIAGIEYSSMGDNKVAYSIWGDNIPLVEINGEKVIKVCQDTLSTYMQTDKNDVYVVGLTYNGTTSYTTTTPVKIASNVKYFTAGGWTAWYIDQNDDLYGWGDNRYGQQGGAGNVDFVPVFTKRGSNVKTVYAYTYVTWYLTNDGRLYGCGRGSYGNQGDGNRGTKWYNDKTCVKNFTQRATNVSSFFCDDYTTSFYITNNGDLYGCGSNENGEMGNGQGKTSTTDYPTCLTRFTKLASNVKKGFAGGGTSWYIDNNDDLYGCGSYRSGQMGVGNIGSALTFAKRASNVKEIMVGAATYYISNNNELYVTGPNSMGEIGAGDEDKILYFTKRAENVASMAVSTTWAAYTTNTGDLYITGDNRYGQQGNGESGNNAKVTVFTKRAENVRPFINVAYDFSNIIYIDNKGRVFGAGKNDNNHISPESGYVTEFTQIVVPKEQA